MKKGTSSDGWKNTGEEAGDTKLAQICLPPRSINFPSLESEGRDSTSHPFFKVHNLHFPPPNPRGPLIRRASEQQLFRIRIHVGWGPENITLLSSQGHLREPACLRSFVVTGCCCMHRHAPIRNNKITVRESASGLKRLLPAKSEMVPSSARPTDVRNELIHSLSWHLSYDMRW